jgi:nitrogen fixation negative regulator NifL
MSKTTPEAVPQGSSTALGALLDSPPEVLSSAVLDDARLFADAAMPLPPRLFLAAVEQAPVAVSITDATARILYVNRAFEALTGYTREELLGRNQSLLSNNATPDTVYQGLWRTIRRKQTWSGTLVNRTKRGGDYLAELTVSPVLDHDGKIAYFLGMHRDVTKVHALERALRQQKTLIETVLDGVILDNQ